MKAKLLILLVMLGALFGLTATPASAGTYTCHVKGEQYNFPDVNTVDAYPYYGYNHGKVDYCEYSGGHDLDKMSVVNGQTGADVARYPTTWNWPNIQADRIEVKVKIDGSADGLTNWHICSDSGYLPNSAGFAQINAGPWEWQAINCQYKWLAGIVVSNYDNGVNGFHSLQYTVDWPNEGCTSFGAGGDLSC